MALVELSGRCFYCRLDDTSSRNRYLTQITSAVQSVRHAAKVCFFAYDTRRCLFLRSNRVSCTRLPTDPTLPIDCPQGERRFYLAGMVDDLFLATGVFEYDGDTNEGAEVSNYDNMTM